MMRRFGILLCAWTLFAQLPLKFMGRAVTITKPTQWDQPASICLEGLDRQCYRAPEDYGTEPRAVLVQLDENTPAVLFAASTGGAASFDTHFALLREGRGAKLRNLFPPEMSLPNQGEHSFWNAPSISGSKIFVTASYVLGEDEAHFFEHRYMISTYVRRGPDLYQLADQYTTIHKYDAAKDHILDAERPEILARLKRVMQHSPRQ
jgi:hypothetical protein